MGLKEIANKLLKGKPAIVCSNKCKRKFSPADIKLEKRQEGQFRDEPLTVYFFRCPYCGEIYDSYYMTPTLEKDLEKLRVIAEELKYTAGKAQGIPKHDRKAGSKAVQSVEKKKRKYDRQQSEIWKQQEQLKNYFTGRVV